MNVAQLIKHLQTLPQDLEVVYEICSERCVLNAADITIERHCLPRLDGWVQNYREDKPSQEYVVFSGY